MLGVSYIVIVNLREHAGEELFESRSPYILKYSIAKRQFFSLDKSRTYEWRAWKNLPASRNRLFFILSRISLDFSSVRKYMYRLIIRSLYDYSIIDLIFRTVRSYFSAFEFQTQIYSVSRSSREGISFQKQAFFLNLVSFSKAPYLRSNGISNEKDYKV